MKVEEPISLDILEEDSDLEVVTITGFDNVVKHSRKAAGDDFVEHPVLHHTCAEIPSEYFSDPEKNAKLMILEKEMEKVIRPHGGGALAAIQLGVDARAFMVLFPEREGITQYYDKMLSDSGSEKSVWQFTEEGYSCYLDGFTFFYNPIITDLVEDCKITWDEACFSVPGFRVKKETPAACTVEYQNVEGERCSAKLFGWLAECAIHEIEHSDGVLMTDGFSVDEISGFMKQWDYEL